MSVPKIFENLNMVLN